MSTQGPIFLKHVNGHGLQVPVSCREDLEPSELTQNAGGSGWAMGISDRERETDTVNIPGPSQHFWPDILRSPPGPPRSVLLWETEAPQLPWEGIRPRCGYGTPGNGRVGF